MADAPGSSRQPLWRPKNQQAGAPTAGGSSRRSQFFTALALLLALGGATLAWILFLSPIDLPTFVGVWIDQYHDPVVPVNAFADQEREALKDINWRHTNAFTHQQADLFRLLHKEVGSQPDGTVVVFLSAHAVSRPDGTVCMLPADARLNDERTWMPLAEVLSSFKDFKSKHLFLLVDLMRPLAEPRLGIFGGDVTGAAQQAIEAAVKDDPRLHALWACAPGQTSYVSEELNGSVFVHYLCEGLRGHADGYTEDGRGSSPDGRVSARELAYFVQSRVDRWSRLNRPQRQTPQYAGGAKDFDLVEVKGKPAATASETTSPTYPPWLKKGWEKRDVWWNEREQRLSTELLAGLEAGLLRAEILLSAGRKPNEVAKNLENRLEEIDREKRTLEVKRPTGGQPSLARESARRKKAPEIKSDVLAKYHGLLKLAAKIEAANKADEKDKERLENEKAELLKQFEGGKAFELAWLIFEELLREPQPALERIRFIQKLLASVEVPYEETAFVERLATWKVPQRPWPAKTVARALKVVQQAAQLEEASARPYLQPWVAQELNAASAKRQAAEALLMMPKQASDEEIEAAWLAAQRSYDRVDDDLMRLVPAYRVRDEALVRLPALVPLVASELLDREAWVAALETARELDRVLRAGPAEDATRKLGKLTDTLRSELTETLEDRVHVRARALIEQRERLEPAEWQSISALLEVPTLTVKDRVELWTAARQAAARWNRGALLKDDEENAAPRQTALPAPWDASQAIAKERKSALARARSSFALLRFEFQGDVEWKKATAALERAEREPLEPAAWRDLRLELQRAWVVVPKQ